MKMILMIFISVISFSFSAFADDSTGYDIQVGNQCLVVQCGPNEIGVHTNRGCGCQTLQAYCASQGKVPETRPYAPKGCVNDYSANTAGYENVQSSGTYGVQCAAATEAAVNKCDPDKDSGISNAKQGLAMLASVGGMQGACSTMGSAAMGANAAMGTFSGICTSSYMSCKTACDRDLEAADIAKLSASTTAIGAGGYSVIEEDIRKIKINQRKCASLQDNLMQTAQAMTGLIAAKANMDMCKQLTGNSADTGSKIADCSDPSQAMTNTVCICMANPADARCGNSGKIGGTYNQSSTGGTDGLNNGVGGAFGDDGGGAGSGYGDISMGNRGEQASGSIAKGSAGGSRSGAQGGGGNGAAGGPGGGAGSNINTKILSGYVNGGRGGMPGMGGGSGSAGAGYGSGGQVAYNGQQNPSVDLKQFMPGGKMDPQRGLAGISGPDGITGPHTDIWKKVNKRYFSVSPSLLP